MRSIPLRYNIPLSLLVLIAVLSGCFNGPAATKPRNIQGINEVTYKNTLEFFDKLHDQKLLTADQEIQVATYRERCYRALRIMRTITDKTSEDYKSQVDAYQAALDELVALRSKIEGHSSISPPEDPTPLLGFIDPASAAIVIAQLTLQIWKAFESKAAVAVKEGREMTEDELREVMADTDAEVVISRIKMPTPAGETEMPIDPATGVA